MNRVYYFALLLSLGLAFTACKGDKASSSDTTDTTATTTTTTSPSVVPPTTTGGVAGVEHYACPNGHVGSGAAQAGSCSQCSAALVHNQAFHANDPAPATPAAPAPSFNNQAQPAAANPAITPPAEPAQNAAGVFHYTCGNGCAGGGGGAGSCGSCGGALAHNPAYHN